MQGWVWCKNFGCVIGWAMQWQTLITGIIALIASVITVSIIRKQIKQSDKHYKDNIDRKHRAIKSGLCLAINEISSYSEDCFRVLCELADHANNFEDESWEIFIQSFDEPLPTFPTSSFDLLRDAIESSPIEDSKKLAKVISYGQVQKARFEDHLDNILYGRKNRVILIDTTQVQDQMCYAAALYSACDWMFPYVRDERDHIGDFPTSPNIGLLISYVAHEKQELVSNTIFNRWEGLRKEFE